MSYYSLKKVYVLLICLLTSVLFCSACYQAETDEKNNYFSFKEKMQEKNTHIYNILPDLNNDEYIDDIYLYYSDNDFLDSFYTVYLKCTYNNEQYESEYKRLLSLCDEYTTIDSSSFNYNSFTYDNSLEANSKGMVYMRYSYVLFDKDNTKIIYVMIFEKTEISHIEKIPNDYLPIEYVNTRVTQG